MFLVVGESVPVSKVPVVTVDKNEYFSIRSNNRSMLFCGTKLLQSRGVDGEEARAMVIRTGMQNIILFKFNQG
jgi:magnesium-transporting ATPase (P-type)